MIERRQIDHIELVQLGKMLLLLSKRQELLLDFPSITQSAEEIVPTDELSKGFESSEVECRMRGSGA